MADTQNKETIKALKQISKELVSNFVGELISQDKVSSGNLTKSFEFEIRDFISSIDVDFLAEDYYKWIISGRKPGKWVKSSIIENWVKEKGIETKENKIKSVAFLINRKIFEKGIKPIPVLENVIGNKDLEQMLAEKLETPLQLDIQNQIDSLVEEYFNNKAA